jgi:hypothetical protein
MRAKSVNEAQNFERGLDPKESMDIGLKVPSYEQVRDTVYDQYDEMDLFINDYILDHVFRKFPLAKPEDISMAINAMSDEIMDTWEQTTS